MVRPGAFQRAPHRARSRGHSHLRPRVARPRVPVSGFVFWTFVLAALCFFASFAGIGNLAVTVYGLRADFLHLPLIFVMPRVLRAEDLRRMGLALLLLLIPMTLLAVKQFQAGPKSSW